MHFVFAVIIKMIMMFSPSISWAPSDKISLAFVESGRGAVSSKRLTWFLDLLRWESSGHCVFSPCSTDTVPFSCRVGNPNSQACVWPSIQFCLMCLQTSEREGKKISTMLLGSVNPRLGYFIPISPPPSPPCRKVSGSEWFLSSLWYDLMSLWGWILSVLTRWLHLDGVAGSDVLQK